MAYSLYQGQGKDEQHGWLGTLNLSPSLTSDHHHALAGEKVYVLQCHQLFISSWPPYTPVFPPQIDRMASQDSTCRRVHVAGLLRVI